MEKHPKLGWNLVLKPRKDFRDGKEPLIWYIYIYTGYYIYDIYPWYDIYMTNNPNILSAPDIILDYPGKQRRIKAAICELLLTSLMLF